MRDVENMTTTCTSLKSKMHWARTISYNLLLCLLLIYLKALPCPFYAMLDNVQFTYAVQLIAMTDWAREQERPAAALQGTVR